MDLTLKAFVYVSVNLSNFGKDLLEDKRDVRAQLVTSNEALYNKQVGFGADENETYDFYP